MKIHGKGNPFDAMGREIAPRTQYLMTNGPYRYSRNPMMMGEATALRRFFPHRAVGANRWRWAGFFGLRRWRNPLDGGF